MPLAPLPCEVADEYLPSANDHDQIEHELPVQPVAWRGWRVAIEPLFFFTSYSHVSSEFYEHYRIQTFDEAVGKLFDERRLDHVGYRCYAINVNPAFACTVDWPLLRRGRRSGIAAYDPRPRIIPNEPRDTTLFIVWRRPNGAMGFTFTYMLSVHGRLEGDAVANWETMAGYFRAARRRQLEQR